MDEVSKIENNCISLRTKKRYNTTASAFIIWAYQNLRGILWPEFSEQVDGVLFRGGGGGGFSQLKNNY